MHVQLHKAALLSLRNLSFHGLQGPHALHCFHAFLGFLFFECILCFCERWIFLFCEVSLRDMLKTVVPTKQTNKPGSAQTTVCIKNKNLSIYPGKWNSEIVSCCFVYVCYGFVNIGLVAFLMHGLEHVIYDSKVQACISPFKVLSLIMFCKHRSPKACRSFVLSTFKLGGSNSAILFGTSSWADL